MNYPNPTPDRMRSSVFCIGEEPAVGSTFHTNRLGEVEIVAVHDFGTVDVRKVGTDRYFRVSGLTFKRAET